MRSSHLDSNMTFQSFCRSLVLVLGCSLTLAAPAEADPYSSGMAKLKAKEYAGAADDLLQASKADPSNFTALYYAANALFRTGRKDDAISLYWYIARHFSTRKEAYQVRDFLKKYDSSYAAHSATRTFGAIPAASANAGSGSTSSEPQVSSGPVRSKTEIIEDIVKVVRPLKMRPNVSKGLIDGAKTALKAYPDKLLEVVYLSGCRIQLTPTLIDFEPGAENTKPRGYEDGSTFKDCPGMFTGKAIVVCEYTIGNGYDCSKTSDPLGTLRHELGHAVDWFLGDISHSEEFKHAYYLDSGKVDASVAGKISYYLQKASGGPSETFAELMAFKYGGRENKARDEACDIVGKSFPLATKILEKNMSDDRLEAKLSKLRRRYR